MRLTDVPVRGSVDARVVLVEFTDYECPFCSRHSSGVAGQINERFVADGRVRYAIVNNPLPSHPNARMLAAAAVCAYEQERFWEMHAGLFDGEPRTRQEVLSLAEMLGVDVPQFTQCIDGDSAYERLEREAGMAQEFGLQGTPSFAIGVATPDGDVRLVKFLRGAQPLRAFARAIEDVLSTISSA